MDEDMTASRKKRRIPLLFGITFRFVLTVAALCLFLSYISSYIDPSRFSAPLFFGLYFIPILAINIILFMIALLGRSKSVWIPLIAILPAFARFFGVNQEFAQFFGGTSLLILVGVVLDTLQQIESYLLVRHYDGLLSSGRIRSRQG